MSQSALAPHCAQERFVSMVTAVSEQKEQVKFKCWAGWASEDKMRDDLHMKENLACTKATPVCFLYCHFLYMIYIYNIIYVIQHLTNSEKMHMEMHWGHFPSKGMPDNS